MIALNNCTLNNGPSYTNPFDFSITSIYFSFTAFDARISRQIGPQIRVPKKFGTIVDLPAGP